MATIVEGNPKAPFSIATTPMCRGGRYSFPGIIIIIIIIIIKLWNMKVTVMPFVIGVLGKVTKRIGTGTGGHGNKRTS